MVVSLNNRDYRVEKTSSTREVKLVPVIKTGDTWTVVSGITLFKPRELISNLTRKN